MLNYDYRSYFYDQSHKKNILIVSQTCTVTARPGKAPRVDTSNVENPVVITNDDIVREEFEIDEALNSSNNLSFGTCEAGLIKFTIRHSRRIPFLNEVGETKAHSEIVKLYFYFDDDSSTLMYYGMYICQRDELSDEGDTRSIECVDLVAMLRDFDIYEWYKWKFLNLEPEDISGQGDTPDPSSNDDEPIPEPKEMTIKQIRDAMFNFINGDEEVPPEIPLDFYVPIQQDNITLPNDNWKFKYRVTTEKLSFMQMLEDICEISGTFGHIGRKLITATDRCVFEYVTLPRYDVEIDNWNKIRNNYATRNFKHDYFITKGIRTLTIYNNEAKEIARYEKGIPVDEHGNKNYNAYSEYIIYDNKFIDDVEDDSEEAESYTTMLKQIYGSIRYRTYTPYEITVQADLCREVGDRIGIVNDFDPYDNKDLSKEKFKTYILEKVTKGIQNMTDTYTAKGDRVIPKFGDSSSSSGYYSYTGGGYTVSSKPGSGSTTDSNEGNVVNAGLTSPEDLVEYIRNFGIRLLAEPKVEYEMTDDGPSFRWEDPADITNNRPCPATWAGTVIVRKKGSAPRNRWDFKSATGGLLVDSTTRDEYKDDPIVDDGSVLSARNQSFDYYYGIFPYDTEGHYRFTKIVKVKRQSLNAPNITGISKNGLRVTVDFIIPNASYEYIKLVYKKDAIPVSSSDGTAIDLQQSDTSKIVNMEYVFGVYYFVIFASNSNGNESESNEVSITLTNEQISLLLDSENHYRSDIVNDFVTFSDYGAYFSFDSNDVLGVNATGGNSNYCAKTPLYKDSATKMYVELEVTYALSQRNVIIDIYKNIPTQTFGEVVWEWKQLEYPYTRGTYEISLSNVPPDEPFYVGFHKADVNLKIYKIWFDSQIRTFQTINIFVNGEFNTNAVPGGLSLTNYVINKASRDIPDISTLSANFLTNKILYTGQYNAETFYKENDYIRKEGTHGDGRGTTPPYGAVGDTVVNGWIPINRIYNAQYVKFEMKIVQYNGLNGPDNYNIGYFSVSYVQNGEMISSDKLLIDSQEWGSYSLDVSNIPYIDYIYIEMVDGSAALRNVKILYINGGD